MPVLQNASELHRFLGMLACLGKFIPNLSSKTSELRKLLEADIDWNWTQEHSKEFKELQQLLTKSPTPKYLDPNLPIKVSVDARKSGLGAVLLHWCPVAYASRALTKTEQNYSQIEKETLAVVYGTEHFNQYVYGQEFLVGSDHKPFADHPSTEYKQSSPAHSTHAPSIAEVRRRAKLYTRSFDPSC